MSRILKIILMLVAFLFGLQTALKKGDRPLKKIDNVAKILVLKSKRELSLISKEGKTLVTYKIALGFQPVGHKNQEGDGKTPEGFYKIDYRQNSKDFYKSLHISYPNEKDKEQAEKIGLSPGGLIMIHGVGNGWRKLFRKIHKLRDWTLGCIALDNEEIDEIWQNVKDGTTIEIRK